jgi:hypothetical protein
MAPNGPPDPLDDLRERLGATREAAERLAEDPPRVPPQGWATPPRAEGQAGPNDELAALVARVHALRDLAPPELQQQVTELIRQVLLLVRALVDHWIERLEAEPPGERPDVEDIPIG